VRWLSKAELESLLTLAHARGGYAPALILLGAYAGLRIGEIVHARRDWLDVDNRLLRVRATDDWHPKGNKERTLPLHRALLPLAEGGELLVPVTKRAAQQAVTDLARQAGLDHVTAHTLRHTFASRAVMEGVPLYTVSHWLGHASITTTQIYAHLAPQHDLMDRLG